MSRHLFLTKLCHNIKDSLRYYSSGVNGSTYQQDLVVQTFCEVNIKVPFNVIVKPLDVHQYHNCDKLIVKLTGNGNLKTSQDGNVVEIISEDTHLTKDTICSVKAPIKANLNVETTLGDITIGAFQGDSVILKSLQGNITAKRYEGHTFYSKTNTGNINLNGIIQAVNICAKIQEAGSITTDRLQGGHATLVTKNGNVSVKSSYCKESTFETDTGDLMLDNVHQNCHITINKMGKLCLTGFDGKMNTNLEDVEADLQISRFTDDSTIALNKGLLVLRLSEDSQHNTFHIEGGRHVQYNDVKLNNFGGKHIVNINGGDGNVELRTASWFDMIKQKVNKQ